jgi:EAL domain-containing protein (putative c-di-GMP-specific phosphodiesterase class I)
MHEAARIPVADISADAASPLAAAMAAQDRQSVAMVEAALGARRVRLAFQPVVIGTAPDRIGYWEGLTRVLDDTGRAIPAREFMAAVEATETGRQIDCLALEAGLQTLRQNPGLRIAVNMSARSIGYPRFQRILRRELVARRGVAERLILEISENSALIVPELVTAFMAEVQDEGVAFALDDFGAGFTSFRHLRDFGFEMVKIDGQFVRGVTGNPDNQTVVRALLAAAREFDMLTIAESVETEAEAAFLRKLGIGAMQGYLYGAPTVRPPWTRTEPARRRA